MHKLRGNRLPQNSSKNYTQEKVNMRSDGEKDSYY